MLAADPRHTKAQLQPTQSEFGRFLAHVRKLDDRQRLGNRSCIEADGTRHRLLYVVMGSLPLGREREPECHDMDSPCSYGIGCARLKTVVRSITEQGESG